MGIESGFVCLMLSYNHQQRKIRNLSCTNQFNNSRSLTSLEKSKKTTKNSVFQNLNKKRKSRVSSIPNQFTQKFQPITDKNQLKKKQIKSKHYEHNYR